MPTGRMVVKPEVLALPIRAVKSSLVLAARICASSGAIGLGRGGDGLVVLRRAQRRRDAKRGDGRGGKQEISASRDHQCLAICAEGGWQVQSWRVRQETGIFDRAQER